MNMKIHNFPELFRRTVIMGNIWLLRDRYFRKYTFDDWFAPYNHLSKEFAPMPLTKVQTEILRA